MTDNLLPEIYSPSRGKLYKAPLTCSEPDIQYLADFLPDFFSQTNLFCLEDFLCYTVKSLRTYDIKLYLSGLKLANLGELKPQSTVHKYALK